MSRTLTTRLMVLFFSVAGSAFVLAEGSSPDRTVEDAPFNFNTIRNIARDQMPCVVNIISDLGSHEDMAVEGQEKKGKTEAVESDASSKGMGSGIILSADGYILTNYHVVEENDTVQAVLFDGTSLNGRVVGRDPEMDIALVKVEANRILPVGVLGDSKKLEIGDWVLAIGSPYGLTNSVSAGIVSALGRDIHSGNYDNFIQTDAAINVGNSGGPLFNLRGEVIGINTAILSTTGGSNGIGFAIPINDLKKAVEQLKHDGQVTRGWLGVALADPAPQDLDRFGLRSVTGAVITDVWDGSPASLAGLSEGDVILGFGPDRIDRTRSLLFAVATTKVGSKVPLEVLRQGKRMSMNVVIAERPEQTEVVAGIPLGAN